MDIRPIKTEADYDWALAEVEQYFDDEPQVGSPEGNHFEVLVELISAYEAKHWPIEDLDPVEAIAYAMELKGWKQVDLAKVVGSRPRASEIMNRKRPLTLGMIQKINAELGVPADVLVKPYHVEAA